jgi:hypothetical protein
MAKFLNASVILYVYFIVFFCTLTCVYSAKTRSKEPCRLLFCGHKSSNTGHEAFVDVTNFTPDISSCFGVRHEGRCVEGPEKSTKNNYRI